MTTLVLAVLLPTGNGQLTIFAVFAAFALLVMGDYGGPVAARAQAYVATALIGAALVVIGTAASNLPPGDSAALWFAVGAAAAR